MFSNTSFSIDKEFDLLNLFCDIDDLKYVLINFCFEKLFPSMLRSRVASIELYKQLPHSDNNL